jgi:hypothetical protein
MKVFLNALCRDKIYTLFSPETKLYNTLKFMKMHVQKTRKRYRNIRLNPIKYRV